MSDEKQKIKPIYDPRRAIEHIQTLSGLAPVRFFAILFPLWDVETTATQEEGRPYELMERFVERGIDEGQLHSVGELSAFFGLQVSIVEKILSFLEAIQHVTRIETRWYLTPLGQKSVREDKKYLLKEKRTKLYFDAYLSRPLLKEHYNRKVRILAPEEAMEVLQLKTWGYHFNLLSSTTSQWNSFALRELEARIDKGKYNVPSEMRGIQELGVRPAYIPMYIIETKRQSSSVHNGQTQELYYVVYTGVQTLRDDYFEDIINTNQTVRAALSSERKSSPEQLWQDWLHEKGITSTLPIELSDETWRVSLPVSAFEKGGRTKLSSADIGDFEMRRGYFVQIWCDDVQMRRNAVLDRTLKLVQRQQKYIKKQAIEENLRIQADLLRTRQLDIDDLRQRATENKMKELVSVLEGM